MRRFLSATCCLVFAAAFFTAVGAFAQSAPSLSTVLNADGSVSASANGSFDPSGFKLRFGLNGEPRFVSAPQSLGTCTPDAWDTTFTANGADSDVDVAVSDGAGNLYIAGSFNSVNSVPAVRIAKWNGTSWSALGSGITGSVNSIAFSGTDVYVGGQFIAAGGVPALNIAKWNGSSWSQIGSGIGTTGSRYVETVAVSGSDLYVGGTFSISTGAPADGIARWDGASWSALGTGIIGTVNSIAITGGTLYAGGNLALPGGGSSIGLVKWEGGSWSSTGLSANSIIKDIAISGTDLYVIGSILIPSQSASHVAKLNGTTWTRLGFFSEIIVEAVAVLGTDLYVGGSSASGTSNNLRKWDGTTWSVVGSGGTGGDNDIDALAVFGSTLIIGGSFQSAGGIGARNIATYTGGVWGAFSGTGPDSAPSAIAVSGPDVYVGGIFTSAGPVTVNRIAKWNGIDTWSALGVGVSGSGTDFSSVSAIAVAGGKVYAGGNFPRIGGITASNIAVWSGSNWAPLGTGTNDRVSFITVRGEDVYVGGTFTTAGGVAANRVAKWNGTTWSGLNSGVIPGGGVTGMAFIGNDLYVSTASTAADNPHYLAKYDGNTWIGLAPGMGGHGITSMAVSGSDVYISGGFQAVGGVPAVRIAKWNGSAWSAVGGGLPTTSGSSAVSLAMSGSDLIAVGDFTTAAGAPTNYIARWNGSAWSALGNGLSASASKVFAAGGDIFVSGGFIRAGCNTSANFARWRETVWTGATGGDWHTGTNWGSGLVPSANAHMTISAANATISSADVTVSSLIVANGRTLTIGAGRTLTVSGRLDVGAGTVTGPGTLVVNGDLNLTGGDVTDLASVIINGNVYLGIGKISGAGPVSITACRTGAIAGGSSASFISSTLTRCIDSSGIYRFPVGTGSTYAPVELANITGSGTFTVEPRSGAHPGATGLPDNRLQRWWNLTNGGITQADVSFSYSDDDVVGLESWYRVYRISGGAATQLSTTINTATNRSTVTGVTAFSAWTLAEGQPVPALLFGRVTSPSGRGAAGVIVSLDDGQGNVRWAITSPFGYYKFQNVPTFRSYTVRVTSKRFTFGVPQRVIAFDEFTTSVNFVSSDH